MGPSPGSRLFGPQANMTDMHFEQRNAMGLREVA